MKKFSLLLPVLFFFQISVAVVGDTTVVVAHPGTNLDWNGSFDLWSYIPDSGKTYQKVIMKFTLGAGMPQCSHWDYTVTTLLGKKSGTIDSSIASIDTLTHDTVWNYTDHVNYTEVGRLITPYGNYMDWNWPVNQRHGFDSSWTHPYIYDITDYASFLKDSVNVRVQYDGWSAAFLAKVEFIFIEGAPARTVETVREIYHSYYGYANSTDFENQVTAKTFPIAANVTSAKVTVYISGHGNQGEFDPHSFYIKVNGIEVYSKLFWKDDCDINPVSPQGGTWIFHRANWCPGDKVPIYEVDITPYITPGQSATIDLDLDDFIIQTGASAGYGISAHLITYGSEKNNDVMMEEIIAPNSDKPYLHWNPISTQPKVKIKNTGKYTLNYAEISYWVKGGTKWYYEWHGNLPTFESALITLPAFDWNGLDTNNRVFYAEAKWPNQVPDEYVENNKLESAFKMTPQLDTVFIIFLKTNNQPGENAYVVRNENGDTIRYKNTFIASTQYRDTFHLPAGSYSFDIYDYDQSLDAGDGLQIWLNQPPAIPTTDPDYETTGQLKFLKSNGVTQYKSWDADFGANSHYEFTVGYPLGYNPPKTAPTAPVHSAISELNSQNASMNVFPNPAHDLVHVEIDLSSEQNGKVQMTDVAGRTIREINVTDAKHYVLNMPSSSLAKGIYYVSFITNTGKISKKVVVQ